MDKPTWLRLLILFLFLSITAVAAWVGSFATATSVITWYPNLQKPPWTPPGRVIGAVWTVLYILMALAAWEVWRKADGWSVVMPIGLWSLQLAFNVAWSLIFFGLRMPGAAFAEIVALWVAVVATMLVFWRVSTLAGALFLPYVAWVTFAGFLNFIIWRMND